MAEGGGFEPPRACAPPVFKTGAFNHSAIPPFAIILSPMDLQIAGKHAMVAAGSKGIGFAAARRLVEAGCHVSFCGRTEEVLARAQAELGPNSHGTVCDVSDPGSLEHWFGTSRTRFGPVSILVTNTGGPKPGLEGSLTDEDWRHGVDNVLLNVTRMVGHARADMVGANWGRIVHVTSFVAKEPDPILAISATLRAGLVALTKLQAQALGPHGVAVNSVLPGHTLTDRQRHLAEVNSERLGISYEEALGRQAMHSPMARFGDPDELGAVIAFLCSVPAGYVSGVSLAVDGAASRGI